MDANSGEDNDRPTTVRHRSASSHDHSRSRSLVIVATELKDSGAGEQSDGQVRGRLPSFRQRSRSANDERSRSHGNRASSNPPRLNLESESDNVDKKSTQDGTKPRSRTNTLNKIPEHVPASVLGGVSEWSHQALAPRDFRAEEKKEDEWQDMPALGKYDLYDDEGKLVARGTADSDNEDDAYDGQGGAGKGYTRVQIDDDAKSATSMDENTSYLFKENGTNVVDEDEGQRDPLAQMQATKDMLTEGQRIAYVGLTRLAMVQMVKALEDLTGEKVLKKELSHTVEAMKMWGQKMMVRLYGHMEIDSSGTTKPLTVTDLELTLCRTNYD